MIPYRMCLSDKENGIRKTPPTFSVKKIWMELNSFPYQYNTASKWAPLRFFLISFNRKERERKNYLDYSKLQNEHFYIKTFSISSRAVPLPFSCFFSSQTKTETKTLFFNYSLIALSTEKWKQKRTRKNQTTISLVAINFMTNAFIDYYSRTKPIIKTHYQWRNEKTLEKF